MEESQAVSDAIVHKNAEALGVLLAANPVLLARRIRIPLPPKGVSASVAPSSIAAAYGCLAMVRFLAKRGANVRAYEDEALRRSAENGHLGVVCYLVRRGANVCANDDEALRLSAKNGHLNVVRFLVKRGANVRARNDYALRWSAANGHLGVVCFLVEQGADVHAWEDEALRGSAVYGHLGVVSVLVHRGATVRARNDVPLCRAAGGGHLDVVRFLLEQGADVHAQRDYALRWSVGKGHWHVAKFLLRFYDDNAQLQALMKADASIRQTYEACVQDDLMAVRDVCESIVQELLPAPNTGLLAPAVTDSPKIVLLTRHSPLPLVVLQAITLRECEATLRAYWERMA